ncbi:hypothetical protein CWR48_11495 [Oceanobacillus arenosus]|uniref:Uncharacterized protein n=1 Tax=Oceanobacillus arenosus TaxID=1229153 RepID=A0A3D8PQG0_9BACI|nr:hypothetical protein [Oceanobacillus arenosus]RDW18204.1 hypothetical protein CWR48_11495 [Oceanobacillus arenosus]
MKKLLLATGLIIIFVGVFIFYNKLYYPSLPKVNMSKKEVIEIVNNSDKEIAKLSSENGNEWYIIHERNTAAADKIIKEMLNQNDWVFKQKDGSGLFFEKQGENLIVSTQKWTADYMLVKILTNSFTKELHS